LAISRGDTEHGITLLQASLLDLRATRYDLFTTSFNISLVQALIALDRPEAGMSLADAAIRSVETNGDFCYMPELLRVKADLFLRLPHPQDDQAMACFTGALELSRQQGALAWELRTCIDMATWFSAHGRSKRARALLQPVVDRFRDGATTADLMVARDLLASWD
jgi:predicted ATPase